jgi:two-component system CheB/CheR fusion protein
VSTVFVDHELRIQRFTPAVTKIINLIQHDVGRPVGHLASNLVGYDRLAEDTRMVLADLAPREAEVQTRDGQWHLMRIMPYRTVENVIEGAVLTFIDITRQKEVQEQLRVLQQAQEIQDLATNVVDTVRGPLLVLDADLRVVSANRAFCEIFRVKREETVGRLLYHLGRGNWDIPELQQLLEKVLPRRRSFKDFRVTVKGTEGGQRVMLLNARELSREAGKERLILLAMEEVADMAGRAGPNKPARRPAKGASRRAR